MSAESTLMPWRDSQDARSEHADHGPGGSPHGELVVAWQNPASRLIAPVGLLQQPSEETYRFRYLRRALATDGFTPFLSFPDWARDYRSDRLFPLFSQRVMSARRPDYPEFLRQLHLAADATPWEQLARSEGRRTGDTVQVFPVPSVVEGRHSVCRFLVHGIRHANGGHLPALMVGNEVHLRDDATNPVNPAAVHVVADGGAVIGHVPDLLLEHLSALRSAGRVSVTVEHVNGPEAPMHLRVLLRMEGMAPRGYHPMRGPAWDTFV